MGKPNIISKLLIKGLFTVQLNYWDQTSTTPCFFTPKVLDNGNVELHATKMSLGKFPVPISFVLLNVKHAYKLPKWVKLIPDKKMIKLDIVHMNGNRGLNYRARQINLNGQGKFAFDIILPKEAQGD